MTVTSSVMGMSEDSMTDSGTRTHCTYCWAIWDDRSTVRFWYIDGDLFCEVCATYEADAILGGLRAQHPDWPW